MEYANACRCCLAQGLHKDIKNTYIWLDKKEIYADMLQECFNIVLSSTPFASDGICDACIKDLRTSLSFKHRILEAEQELMIKLKELDGSENNDMKLVTVKIEPDEDSDGDSDYFLADAVTEPEVEIKKEKEPTEKRIKKVIQKPAEVTLKVEDMKSFTTKFTTIKTTTASGLPKLTIKRKPLKLLLPLPDSKQDEQRKINLMWTTRMSVDKTKHRDNLHTILQYSNVIPFKDKSLLGYMCAYCEATFPDPANLRIHTDKDHSKDRLSFKSSFDMTEYHVKVDITDLSCTLCDATLSNLTELKDHLVKVHNKTIYNDIKDHILQFKLKKGDIYDCTMCTATYETFKMLKQHMNTHYRNYTCSKCDSSFATKRSWNAHQATHLEGSFKCEYCDKIFPSKPKKQYHEKTKHLGARTISNCPYCNEHFRSYYQRNQHLVKVHNAEAQYKCNVCNKTFILKSLLMYHIKKNHLMERNCQCTECGFRFFSKKALKAHMVKHTGERNYQCEVCHKSYARKYTLREHMRIHNNDRRFRCEVCSMSFVQKCSLKSHLLSNHGISMAASDISCTTPS